MTDPDRLDALKLRFDAQSMRFGAPYAEALRRAGRLEEAVRVIRSTIEARPRNVFGLVVLARCLRDLGHPEDAGVVVREAAALDATDPTVGDLQYLVAFAPSLAPVPDARPMVERGPEAEAWPEQDGAEADGVVPPVDPVDPVEVPSAPPPIFVTETMAELYVQQGLPDRAIAIYRELTARAPEDARLAARLLEVSAQADVLDDRPSRASEALVDLPLLEDFDPLPVLEMDQTTDQLWETVLEAADSPEEPIWSVEDASDPESFGDEPIDRGAFDFSQDALRATEAVSATDDAMLAGLSFDAIALPTPSDGGWVLELPQRSGPSARDALRTLASRSAVVRDPVGPFVVPAAPRPTARPTAHPATPRTTSGYATPSRVAPSSPTGSLGDDFDQWLRGVP